jgi:hypothetical protein
MNEREWMVVDRVAGDLQAELLRGLLEAQGFSVWLNKEGAGHVYNVSVGSLGEVEILVPSDEYMQARQVLDDYYNGVYESTELIDLPEKPAEDNQSPEGD